MVLRHVIHEVVHTRALSSIRSVHLSAESRPRRARGRDTPEGDPIPSGRLTALGASKQLGDGHTDIAKFCPTGGKGPKRRKGGCATDKGRHQ